MDRSLSSKFALAGLAFLVASIVMAPLASAQGTSLIVGTPSMSPSGPIRPDTGEATLTVPWDYRHPPGSFLGQTTAIVQITWTPSCTNPSVFVTGSRTQLINIPSDQNTVVAGSTTFKIAVTQDAPGEVPIQCTITGQASELAPNVAPATQPSSSNFNVIAGYLGLVSVNVPTSISQAGPQKEIRYELELLNLGNSRSTINFRLQNQPEEGWNPVLPSPIVLESRAQGGQEVSRTVSFLVSTPFKNGWNNRDTTFVVEITPTSTRDVEQTGQTVTVNVLARVRGVYVPTLEPVIMLGAVLGSALVARRLASDDEDGEGGDDGNGPAL